MSISVTGFKGRKNLFATTQDSFKRLVIKTAEEMFMKIIASNTDALITHYAYCKNIDEVMDMVGPLNSINHLMYEFKDYPKINKEMEFYYNLMKSNLTEKTCFDFFENYIKLSNKLNKENPEQHLTYVSSNIVDVSVIEYPFGNYSIYQFFYGSLDLGSLMNEKMKSIKELKDYSYYDGSDRPENASNRTWNKKRKDWLNIIKRCGSYFSWCPKNGGENYHITDISEIHFNIDNINKYKKNKEENIKVLAKKIMLKDFYKIELEKTLKEYGFKNIEELNKSGDLSIYSYAFFDAGAFVKEQINTNGSIYIEYLNHIKEKIE